MEKSLPSATFQYDEQQTKLPETFGTSAKKLAIITREILTNDEYKTLTSGVVGEMDKGNITTADLMAMATCFVGSVQRDHAAQALEKCGLLGAGPRRKKGLAGLFGL